MKWSFCRRFLLRELRSGIKRRKRCIKNPPSRSFSSRSEAEITVLLPTDEPETPPISRKILDREERERKCPGVKVKDPKNAEIITER